MTAVKPVPGPVGPIGPVGPPGPAIGVSGRHYALIEATGQTYHLPNASIPALGTVDIRALVRFDTWAGAATRTLFSVWGASGQRKLQFAQGTTAGLLTFNYTADGATSKSINSDPTVDLGAILGTSLAAMVRVVANPSNSGRASADFYYSQDFGRNWVQIGTTRFNATPGPWAASTADGYIGETAGGANVFNGRYELLEVRDGGGTLQLQLDLRGQTDPTAAVADGVVVANWAPGAGAQLFQDEINDQDFLDGTLRPTRLVPGAVGQTTFLKSTNGAITWGSNLVAPGSVTASDLDVVDVMAELLGYVHPGHAPYSAPLDQINDDQPGIQAVLDAITAQANPFQGSVLYLPGRTPLNPSRGVLLKTHLATSILGLRVVGSGAHGASQDVSPNSPGPCHVIVWEQMLRYNEGGASKFASPQIEGFHCTPGYTRVSGAQVITEGGTIVCNSLLPIASRLPATGTVVIAKQRTAPLTGIRGYYSYSGKSGDTLTGIHIIAEDVPGFSWADGTTVNLAGTAGLGPIVANNIRLRSINLAGFIDGNATNRRTAGFGYWFSPQGNIGDADPDPTVGFGGKISQYNLVSDLWINMCHTGAIEDASSTRYLGCNIEGIGPYPGQRGILGADIRTMVIDGATNVDSHEIDIDIAGKTGGTGNHGLVIRDTRGERFSQRHIRLTDLRDPQIDGGTIVDSLLSSMGTAIEFVRCSNITVKPLSITSVADKFVMDSTTTGIIEASDTGTPEGNLAAPKGSVYRRIDGTALADAGTGLWYVKKTDGSLKTGWAAVA